MRSKTPRLTLITTIVASAVVLTACQSTTNPTQGSFIASRGTNSCCIAHCGFVNFNNNGAGYSFQKGQTVTIQLSLSLSMSPLLDTSTYCVRWRYGGLPNQSGCAAAASSTTHGFTAPAAARYAFSAYIKNDCPANGTRYFIVAR